MAEFGMHQAKTNLSDLVERALGGEEVVITRRGVPVVSLVPQRKPGGIASLIGAWAGQVKIADDFDELPPDIAEAFGVE